ncbi:MAG: hypothetical protein JWQ16_1735 [Novosphingobium sp.]|nr:hypothetical protein [Novosphingobium sp.]
MSSTALTILRCDRCGTEATIAQVSERQGWALIAGILDPRESGARAGDDLCAGCVAELRRWWFEPKGPVPVPTPPALPPRRGLNKAEGDEVATLAAEICREQLIFSLQYYFENPTELLSRTIPELSFDGLSDRARRIARLVASILARRRMPSAEQPDPVPAQDGPPPAEGGKGAAVTRITAAPDLLKEIVT